VHAGICDASMWDGFELPGATRHELRGFGVTPLPAAGEYSHADDLEETLGGRPAVLVGASFGGWVCLHVAARSPRLVSGLVVLDAPLFDHDWSEEVESHWAEEDRLLEQGDLRGAAILNAEFWLADAAPRDRVVAMQELSFELQEQSQAEAIDSEEIPLGQITAPALVAVGELDKPDFHAIAERLRGEIAGATGAVIGGAGHVPALERPAETAGIVQDFLRRLC
jgi:pimeloyl-ACP methyl ester carboxylesterase